MTAAEEDGEGPPEVAHGDRRDALYEPDPDQIVKMTGVRKPTGPLPPQEQSAASEAGEGRSDVPPIEDVAEPPAGPSVWEATPDDDEL